MWSWSRDVVNGMAYMHRAGVIHRDIKPENVLIGVDSSAKIGDFGSAVIVDPGRHGSDVMTDQVGSPAYMSPECAGGDPYHGFRSDIYTRWARRCTTVCSAGYPTRRPTRRCCSRWSRAPGRWT